MPSRRLLIIAPDDEVRKSLVFALEAEGYDVAALGQLPGADWLQSHRQDCTVLDQRAVRPCDRDALSACLGAAPVVLLAHRPQPWLSERVRATVDTPAREGAMLRAVEGALNGP